MEQWIVVFDEWVGGGNKVYFSPPVRDLSEWLDRPRLELRVVDGGGPSPKLTAGWECSSDGLWWSETTLVEETPLDGPELTVLYGTARGEDTGAAPGLVRFWVYLSGPADNGARVTVRLPRCDAAQRGRDDAGRADFTAIEGSAPCRA